MSARFLKLWDTLHSSLWFIPFLMVFLGFGLFAIVYYLNRSSWAPSVLPDELMYQSDSEGARDILAMIAGSMMTIAGVVFSITIVVLAQTANQFGPRLIRNFMYDTGNQIVLGTFIATFVYCVCAYQAISKSQGPAFYLSVPTGSLMALASLGVLIYFIHHMAYSIQAPNVIHTVSKELSRMIDHTFPEESSAHPAPDMDAVCSKYSHDCVVCSDDEGFVQAIEIPNLISLASDQDFVIRFFHRPGDYVIKGYSLARVWSRSELEETVHEQINSFFILGGHRTLVQDPLFVLNQLVEIAVRALSPGINDPFTAMDCLYALSGGLWRLAGRQERCPYHYDEQGELRLVTVPFTRVEMIHSAFTPIRNYGQSSFIVCLRMMQVFADLAPRLQNDELRRALLLQAVMMRRSAEKSIPEPLDLKVIEEHYRKVVEKLGEPTPDML